MYAEFGVSHLFPGPYTSKQRSSNALTIILETCPKNAAETAAWTGLANAKDKSRVTSVGPLSGSFVVVMSFVGGVDVAEDE